MHWKVTYRTRRGLRTMRKIVDLATATIDEQEEAERQLHRIFVSLKCGRRVTIDDRPMDVPVKWRLEKCLGLKADY